MVSKVSRQRKALLLAIGVLLCSGSTNAGLIVFTDRAAWVAAAAPGFVTEDFEDVPDGVLPANIVNDLGLVDLSYTGTARLSTPSINDSGFVNGSRELSGHIFDAASGGGVSEPGPETIFFPGQIRAFGADFFSTVDDDQLLVTVAGETLNFADYLPPVGDGFFGVISDTPFSSILFTTIDSSPFVFAQFFALDNLSFQVVPEPTSLVLASTAIILCSGHVAIRRLRRLKTGRVCRNPSGQT